MAAESPSRQSLDLPADLGAPRTARMAVASWLGEVSNATRELVLLVVSELVTNAVKYGAAPISLLFERSARAITVTVTDTGQHRPRRRAPGPRGGLGLHIVDEVCQHVITSKAETRISCTVQIEAEIGNLLRRTERHAAPRSGPRRRSSGSAMRTSPRRHPPHSSQTTA